MMFAAPGFTKEEGSVRIYPYIFTESTGSNKSTLVGKELKPILKFSSKSSPEAVKSLMALKSNILYENGDGNKIFLRGDYEEIERSFVLRSWFIVAPFYSRELIDEDKLPHEYRVVSRNNFINSDFATPPNDLSVFVIKFPPLTIN